MKQSRRLFLFLLLNIIVSACTTLAVLVFWDQARGPLPKGLLPEALSKLGAPAATAPAAALNPAAPQPTPAQEFVIYQVQAGDTFESVAAAFKVSVQELLAVNGLAEAKPLEAGQVLRVPAQPKGSVLIESVIGAGDLNSERVLLKYQGEGELSLIGWRIEDGKGNVFIFPQSPQLTLFGGGAVNVYTKTGVNSVIDLFWGLDKPIWSTGSTVTLLDAQGNVHAFYQVP